jgi:hypothetical protein
MAPERPDTYTPYDLTNFTDIETYAGQHREYLKGILNAKFTALSIECVFDRASDDWFQVVFLFNKGGLFPFRLSMEHRADGMGQLLVYAMPPEPDQGAPRTLEFIIKILNQNSGFRISDIFAILRGRLEVPSTLKLQNREDLVWDLTLFKFSHLKPDERDFV